MQFSPNLPPRPGQELRTRLLQEAMAAEQTATCAVEIDRPCRLPAITGHIIPESRLQVISRNGEVIVAEPPPANDVQQTGRRTDRITFRPVSPKRATTDEFSCSCHDRETFLDIEQNEVDWTQGDDNIMRRLALLAYKAALPAYVRKDRSARVWERLARTIDHDDPELLPQSVVDLATGGRTEANRAGTVKSLLEQIIRHQDYDHMSHIVTQNWSGPSPSSMCILHAAL